MQCSKKMTTFIYGGVALGAGALFVAAFTQASPERHASPEIVASLTGNDPYFRKMNEVSGIAVAGFRDENNNPLLWGHEERTSHIVLMRTWHAGSLYVGRVTIPGGKTRDAEDIAAVHSDGRAIIYLEDAGSNRKDRPACLRYARKADNPAQCTVADSFVQHGKTTDLEVKKKLKSACLEKGDDWIFVSETDYLAPGTHPEIRRIPEPSYQDVLHGRAALGTVTIEFDYPKMCGTQRCREIPGNKLSDISAAYNTEALAVVVEPDHSHTAYLFTKSSHSLARHVRTQHPAAPGCKFDSDGRSDVFRLRNIDTLAPGKLHLAEYVTTLDLSPKTLVPGEDALDRVTAANFLQLSATQGLLLVRTTGHAYKWPVTVESTRPAGRTGRATFDVAGALKKNRPLPAAVPATNEEEGIGRHNQEAATQLDESTIYYMGECKGLPKCSVAMVHDTHNYLPGDADGNGRIEAADLATVKRFLAGEIALYCKAAADANGDGKITDEDLDYLEQYLAKKGPAPVASTNPPGQPALGCGYYSADVPAVAAR